MNSDATVRWSRFAICIVLRVWLKFGKSRISPVTLTAMPARNRPVQNHSFSPALNLPDGTSRFERRPPKCRIQFQSYLRHQLSRRNVKNSSTKQMMNSGPTKLSRFFERIVSQENSV